MQVVVVALVGAKVPTMDQPVEKAVVGGARYSTLSLKWNWDQMGAAGLKTKIVQGMEIGRTFC